ncbi:MAG: ATP-binding protein [Hydrogenovibrio sp.]|uniref:magnesium chelatase subunit ChlI family protein n=1 Tax=Hydrogenovibrio sp. TaxID=2065821 RepID=UPI00286FDBA7|nr:ATP-binding protein [Hydrogenovibrio sp.]MDR9498385.1 ATP-binding protein [Hydrogenovibrio sp.]
MPSILSFNFVVDSCKDTPEQIARYQRKLSGPLMDRIDCHLEVPAVEYAELAGQNTEASVETSSVIRARVADCQARQQARQGCLNAQMPVPAMQKQWPLDDATHALLEKAMDRLGLSARGYHRILRVARTLADMQGRKDIGIEEVSEALSYRRLDRWGANS